MALTDEDVGRFIQRLRVERGMTQADLARRVRMHRTAISRLENGFRAVTVPELVEFAGVLGMTAGSTAILSDLSESRPGPARIADERPRADTPVATYSLVTLLMSRAFQTGMRRLHSESNGRSGAIHALVLGSANAVATVILTAAVWTGLLVVWFALFGFVLNGRHQSADAGIGQGEVVWVLFAILLGASLTGGGAYALSLNIQGLMGRRVAGARPQRINHPGRAACDDVSEFTPTSVTLATGP